MGTPIVTDFGEIIIPIENNNGLKPFVLVADNYGHGNIMRIREEPYLPHLYDSRRAQLISVGLNEINILNLDRTLASRIPVSLPDNANLVGLTIDGDRFLVPPIPVPPSMAETNTAYQIDRNGQITKEFAIPNTFYNNPYVVRGSDQKIYVGSSTSEIGVFDETTNTVKPTGFHSAFPLVFDKNGYAYGADAYSIRKMDLNVGAVIAEMRLPEDYVYFDSGFSTYRIAVDNQNRVYVPVAPRGRRVLVFAT